MISGSSSFLGFCILAIVLLEAADCRLLDAPGTLMELKSNMGIARVICILEFSTFSSLLRSSALLIITDLTEAHGKNGKL